MPSPAGLRQPVPLQTREKTALFLVYDREMLIANRAWSSYAERPRFYSMCMLRTLPPFPPRAAVGILP